MRHIPDGVLRRLDDEPLAVPDRVTDHLAGCGRCSARRAQIAQDTERAARLLAAPRLVPDTDLAWARLQGELHRREPHRSRTPAARGQRRLTSVRRQSRPVRWRRARFPTVSLRAALIAGAIGILIAGTAAATSLTTIFAPTHVAPISLSQGDLRAITALTGLGNGNGVGGFPTPDGSRTVRFGTVTWSSGPVHPVSSLAQASARAGFPVYLPTHLPTGVGAVRQFTVVPRVHATVTFNSSAGGLSGSSVSLDSGPAVVAGYSGANGTDLPTLAVAAMPRPTAHSTRASLRQIEAFLLAQPGIPPALAEEVRLLGDLRTILPVPVPSGASVRSVQIRGWPGVLLADSSNAAAGVVWEDGRGMLHAVVGILDQQDVLNVAQQLG